MIKHKFELGQEVWVIDNSSVVSRVVTTIFVPRVRKAGARSFSFSDSYELGEEVYYGFTLVDVYDTLRAGKKESEVFATKEDLIASL